MTIHLEDFAKNYGVHNSLQWSSFKTYLGVNCIFVTPLSGQRAYSEIKVKRCQLHNGEEYGCFGLATDETCLSPGDDEGIDRMPALVSEQDSDDEDMPALNNCAV